MTQSPVSTVLSSSGQGGSSSRWRPRHRSSLRSAPAGSCSSGAARASHWHSLGFHALPAGYFAALAGMVVCYLFLVEVGKAWFHRVALVEAPVSPRRDGTRHHLRRRAAQFSADS
jgi:hypothetical protein